MGRSVAGQAERAADALEAFIRNRLPAAADKLAPDTPTVAHPAAGAPTRDRQAPLRWQAAPDLRSRSPARDAAGAPLRLAHPDWLRHRLWVAGPTTDLRAFREAASGAGTIPWRLDLDSLQEDWFHLLITPVRRSLSLDGARVLSAQLREAVERRHAIAVARVGRHRVCPLDLHALVPVPADILALGPDHPNALAWLWRHWGTTEALRHVAPDIAGRPWLEHEPAAGEDSFRLAFWSADWTPWRALARIRADWPTLHLEVQPDYAASG